MGREPLAGRRIVVTRPRQQAAGLAALIREAGGEPLVFPAIEIQDLADSGPILELIGRLEQFHLAIFISPNAVNRALNLVRLHRPGRTWPAQLRIAALGRGSRRALEQHGFCGVLAPQAHADSEALLALAELADLAGKRVVIFRGEGGRELLGDALAARGARVEYAECYRRTRPVGGSAKLLTAWARGAVDAVTVSSSEGLANLFEMLGKLGQQWLQKTPLFVPHPRVADEARRLGVRKAIVAGPGDAEMLERLVAYFGGAK